jgi:hypothetical protein
MIGDRFAWGESGYTILEEGEIDAATLRLNVSHYLVCLPSGEALEGHFTLDQARREIERREAASGSAPNF